VGPRAASGGGAWGRRAATVSGLQKAIPVISDCFGANFCNFKIV
jgi:hypothetical protein